MLMLMCANVPSSACWTLWRSSSPRCTASTRAVQITKTGQETFWGAFFVFRWLFSWPLFWANSMRTHPRKALWVVERSRKALWVAERSTYLSNIFTSRAGKHCKLATRDPFAACLSSVSKRRLVAAPLSLTETALRQPNGGTRAPVTNDLVLTGGLDFYIWVAFDPNFRPSLWGTTSRIRLVLVSFQDYGTSVAAISSNFLSELL